MSYQLRAAIGDAGLLGQAFGPGTVVRLPGGLGLVPLPASDDTDRVGRFYGLSTSLRERLIAASASGPIAYVEAEFFGGVGTQSGIAWSNGSAILGPLHTQNKDDEEPGYTTSSDLAINEVLRLLGVQPDPDRDEFDTLGLGRFRETSDWISLTEGR